MAKTTVKQLEALKPRDKPYKVTVDTGLIIRVATNGIKSWIVQYVVDGKQREYPLPKRWAAISDGAHMSLADARSEAEKIRALARQGIDYKLRLEHELKAEAKRLAEDARLETLRLETEKAENLTASDLLKAWLIDGVRRKDGNAELERSFHADVLPLIGSIPVKILSEHDLRGVLRALVERGVNRSAVVVRNNLKQMFAWAEKRQPWRTLLVNGDPMDLIEIEKIVSPDYDFNNERDRILSDDEIVELYTIFDRMRVQYNEASDKRRASHPIEETTERAVWIMLSTMSRVGETSKARWEHVNFENGVWFIPKANVKGNIKDLYVHLSKFSANQFLKLHQLTGHSEWCFPARNRQGHICTKSLSKQIGDRQAKFKKAKDGTARAPMKHRCHDNTLVLAGGKYGAWTPHDLRRTGSTLMQSMGVPIDIIDRCQNHVLPGSKIRRHYLHHDYAEETREAWKLLGSYLESIIGSHKKPL